MTRQPSADLQSGATGWRENVRPDVRALRSEELGLLSRVLETHCSTFGIRSDEGRDSVAQSVIGYFRSGVSSEEELLASLEREDRPLEKSRSIRISPKIEIRSGES